MKIAIYGSRRQGDSLSRVVRMLAAMRQNGIEIVMHSKLYRHLCSEVPGMMAVDEVVGDDRFTADIAMSLGGDGTFLRTAHWVGDKQIPIVGVNTGHLGYLAAYSIEEAGDLVDDLTTGNYATERRTLLEVVEPELDGLRYALNEVAILRTDHASMISCQVSINDGIPANYQADGILVTTPTGSTGYNLSVGGPIVQPTAPVWTIAPVAAHALTMRPLVVSDDSCISVCTTARARSFMLSLDGNSTLLPVETRVSLRRAPFHVVVIHKKGHRFIETLRNKLHWGV